MDSRYSTGPGISTAYISDETEDEGYEENSMIREMSLIAARSGRRKLFLTVYRVREKQVRNRKKEKRRH
jgi:hypothetical protein